MKLTSKYHHILGPCLITVLCAFPVLQAQDISVFTAATAGEQVLPSPDFVHDFDTTVRSAAAHTLSAGTDIQMSSGRHLVIYNSRFDSLGGTERSEVLSKLHLNGADLSAGWSQAYMRRQNGQDEIITAGGAIINVASTNDVLQLRSYRSDTNNNNLERIGGATGIQLFKLDDNWEYARLTAAASGTQALAGNNTNWTAVNYDVQDELDANYTHTSGNPGITLGTAGHYLVMVNTFVQQTGGSTRDAYSQRLVLDGSTEIPGSRTSTYIRAQANSDGTFRGCVTLGAIIETASSNQVLSVEILQDASTSTNIIRDRSAISIVKLPDTADYIRINDATNGGQNMNPDASTALNYINQFEVGGSFTHSTSSNPNLIEVNSTGDYLFFASQYDASDEIARMFYSQGWQINGAGGQLAYGQTGRYARNSTKSVGNWSGLMVGLNAGNTVETVVQRLGNAGTNTATHLALQGIRVDNIFGPDVTPPSISVTDPPDDAINVYLGTTELVANFSEAIALTGSGIINLVDTNDGSSSETFNLPSGQISVVDNQLTITPTISLESGTTYEVTVDGNALEDEADTPNAYGGTTAGEWTFTVAPFDGTGPAISSTNPADDAANIPPSVNLVATFDENLIMGSGNITLVDLTDGSGTQVFAVPGPNVSIAGTVLTIDPPLDLEGATDYAVQLDAGVVKNFSDVGNLAISDTTIWNFTATDTTTFTGSNSNGRSDNWNVGGNWDPSIPSGVLNAVIPNNKVVTSWSDTTTPYTGDLSIGSGSTLRFGWTTNRPTSWNALGTPGTSVVTMANNTLILARNSGLGTGSAIDIPEIQLTGNATFILSQSTQTSVTMNFDHGVFGPHTLTLQGKGGSVANLNTANTCSDVVLSVQTSGHIGMILNANQAGSLGTGNVTVTANGSGTPAGKLRINAANSIADTAVLDLNGSGASDLITMNADDAVETLIVDGFTHPSGRYGRTNTPASVDFEVSWMSGDGVLTVNGVGTDTGLTNPALTGIEPADDTPDVFIASKFTASFDEPVIAGTGNILIKNLTDATTLTIPASSSQVTFSIFDVIIDPIVNLDAGKDYAIQIEPTAITDAYGNPYAGITDDTTWNFTVESPVVLFSDGFESPDVTAAESGSTGSGGTSQTANTAKWVRATAGFGASANGIEDEGAGRFTDPGGEQAYRFSYTNSGVTTAEGVIGQLLLGTTYTLSFDVVEDGTGGSGTPWRVKLVVFNPGASRTDTRNNNGTTVLLERNGNAPAGGAYDNQSFTFTPTPAQVAAHAGKDIAIRFIGSTNTANIDNVVLSASGETIAPTLVSITDDTASGQGGVGTPITYTVTFDEPIDPASMDVTDFENGSTAGINVDSVEITDNPAVYLVTVTPTSTGDLTLQVPTGADIRDGAGNTLDTASAIPDDTTLTILTPYNYWVTLFPTITDTGPNENDDGDDYSNLMEFAFGTDPTNGTDDIPLVWSDPALTFGGPTLFQNLSGAGVNFKARFIRRTDHGQSGSVSYVWRFSSDMTDWEDSDGGHNWVTPPNVITTIGDYQLVEVVYPFFLDSFKKARFFQMRIAPVP